MRKVVIISLSLGVTFLLAGPPAPRNKKTPTKSARSKRPPLKAASWRNKQRIPTPDRYKDIQQALAAKGYLQADAPMGVWDNSSIEALKNFQRDQNLEPSGKIDSLSLIALGLGPRRDTQPVSQP